MGKRLSDSRLAPLCVGELVIFRALTQDQENHYGIANGDTGEIAKKWSAPSSLTDATTSGYQVLVLPLVKLKTGRQRAPFRVHRWRLQKLTPLEQLALAGNEGL